MTAPPYAYLSGMGECRINVSATKDSGGSSADGTNVMCEMSTSGRCVSHASNAYFTHEFSTTATATAATSMLVTADQPRPLLPPAPSPADCTVRTAASTQVPIAPKK